jgi:hypothetical protein
LHDSNHVILELAGTSRDARNVAIAASRVVALKKASNRKKSLKQAMKESPEEDAEMTEAKSPRRSESSSMTLPPADAQQ